MKLQNDSLKDRLEREVERERHQRLMNDEWRAGLAVDEEYRIKDARSNEGAVNLRRQSGR
ncbi:hypothetical protein QPK32_23020 [Massilia sp. YIM B02763]|uniref:hypothetical protein n=1 Tax=Massilia sp. YIM B02763 TaxID=3050130 RepID=UPI0025B71FC2|nr:hypothetical protein [Massilia sp. YIM B02763]MDN4055945.1 hypothetical protein [Massilia sp. YIM B02763]